MWRHCSSRGAARPQAGAGVRWSLFGHPGLAEALDNLLELGQIRRVVAHRRPGGAGAGNGVGRVEREASLDCGMRLVESTKLCEGGGQPGICWRKISVGLDRPPSPRDRFLPTAEVALRPGCTMHPHVSHRVARTEAQGLGNVSLCFFGATDQNLAKSDKGMGVGEISIQLQRMLT